MLGKGQRAYSEVCRKNIEACNVKSQADLARLEQTAARIASATGRVAVRAQRLATKLQQSAKVERQVVNAKHNAPAPQAEQRIKPQQDGETASPAAWSAEERPPGADDEKQRENAKAQDAMGSPSYQKPKKHQHRMEATREYPRAMTTIGLTLRKLSGMFFPRSGGSLP